MPVHQLQQPLLRVRLGVRRDRHVVEVDAVGPHQRLRIGVVGHHRGDLDLQRAGAGAEEQVVEAVQVARDHHQRPVRRRGVPELELHRELAARRRRSPGAGRPRRPRRRRVKSMRMKNRPERRSPNCWLSRMLPPWRTRKPLTACTIPGRSGHESTRTKSPDAAVAEAVPPAVMIESRPLSRRRFALRATERSLRYATTSALVSRSMTHLGRGAAGGPQGRASHPGCSRSTGR